MPGPRSTASMRREYADALCALSPGGDRTQIATFRVYGWPRDLWVIKEGVEAFDALSRNFEKYDYPFEEIWGGTLVCRAITGGTLYSPHAYGVALDINPSRNPYIKYTGQPRSTWTDMPQPMIDDIKSIRTAATGRQVFDWGGDWNTVKDAMHFQIGADKSELDEGLVGPGTTPGTTRPPMLTKGTPMLGLKPGDVGPEVQAMQYFIDEIVPGALDASGGKDSKWGPGTSRGLVRALGRDDVLSKGADAIDSFAAAGLTPARYEELITRSGAAGAARLGGSGDDDDAAIAALRTQFAGHRHTTGVAR